GSAGVRRIEQRGDHLLGFHWGAAPRWEVYDAAAAPMTAGWIEPRLRGFEKCQGGPTGKRLLGPGRTCGRGKHERRPVGRVAAVLLLPALP
ncbi:MAG TPA: hypothetical protein VMZ71_07655, partial [Gemmataceae bacterium]|nr:hypothetical protein [Gemmataceae bacterium]